MTCFTHNNPFLIFLLNKAIDNLNNRFRRKFILKNVNLHHE
jgi:hypothetical protein